MLSDRPGLFVDRLARGALVVAIAVVLFFPLGFEVFRTVDAWPKPVASAKVYAISLEWARPEPAERTVYLLSMPFLFGAIFLLYRSRLLADSSKAKAAGMFALAVWLGFFLFCFALNNRIDFDYGVILPLNIISVLPPVWLGFCYWAVKKWLCTEDSLQGPRSRAWRLRFESWGMVFGWMTIGLLGLAGLFSETNPYVFHAHCTAMMHSVLMASFGKVALADFVNQYGLYAQLVQPVYVPLANLLGSKIAAFCGLFAALTAITWIPFVFFLKRAVANPFIRTLGLLAALQWTGLAGKLINFWKDEFTDPYFQYFPIRTLFPFLLIGFHSLYFNKPKWLTYWLFWVGLSVGVLWNLDSGVVALVAWALTLGFDRTLRLRHGVLAFLLNIAIHLGAGLATLVVVGATYRWIVGLAYGKAPDFSLLLNGVQKMFYLDGFTMLPMKLVSVWNLWAAIYLAGFACSADAWRRYAPDLRARSIFLLSVLGCGLFSYFQGRSHPYNLLGMSYLPVLMLTLFADGLWARRHELVLASRPARALLPIIISLLSALALTSLYQAPLLGYHVLQRWTRAPLPSEASLADDWAYFRQLPGLERGRTQILGLTEYSTAIHSITWTPAPFYDSFYEIFLVSQLDALASTIDQGVAQYVVIDPVFEREARRHEAYQRALSAVTGPGSRYTWFGASPSGLFTVFALRVPKD